MKIRKAYSYDDVYLVPKYSCINHRSQCNLKSQFTRNYFIDIPIISSPMDTVTGVEMVKAMDAEGGVGILHRFEKNKNQIEKIKRLQENVRPLSVAIGLVNNGDKYEKLLKQYHRHGVRVLCIDVANGYHKRVIDTVQFIRNHFKDIFDIIVGNICTDEAAEYIQHATKVDAFRVNIGNGSLCTTRQMTGVGVPSITAIDDIAKVSKVPIIADGGIRSPGDVAKALAAGADTVMIGSLLSGTKETPGRVHREGLFPDEVLYKRYRGAASYDSKIDNEYKKEYVEGVSTRVKYKGKVKRIIKTIKDGLRSSMSYLDAKDLDIFRMNAEFVEVSNAGHHEAKPHLLFNE